MTEKLNKKVIIVGHGASGKDYLRQAFVESGYKDHLSWTTRPMRPGETNGVDMQFVTDEEFMDAVENGLMLQWQKFNGWKYGTLKTHFEEADVLIMNVPAVEKLRSLEEYKDRIFVVYINIPEVTRKMRLKERKDSDTVTRRLEADKQQFRGFYEYDYMISHSKYDGPTTVKLIAYKANQ